MSTLPEVLLTSEQLEQVTVAAAEYLLKYEARILIEGLTPTSIQRVSLASGLIMVAGNEYTGMHHIRRRHSPASLLRTWVDYADADGKPQVRLDDPSRFRPYVNPIFDYIDIADVIYLQGKLDESNNLQFDKYVGSYTFSDGITVKHTLILYKNTKIIHTLYPQKSFPKRDKISGFLFRRGQASSAWNTSNCKTITNIPYFSREGELRYAIIIQLDTFAKFFEFELIRYSSSGQPMQYMSLGNQFYEGEIAPDHMSEVFRWQYVDFSKYESIMRDTENGLIT